MLDRHFDTKNILLNPPIPEDWFTVEALNLDESVKVLARSVDNEASVLVKSPNGFVPVDRRHTSPNPNER